MKCGRLNKQQTGHVSVETGYDEGEVNYRINKRNDSLQNSNVL